MNAEFSGLSEGQQSRPAPAPEPGAFVPCRFKLGDKVVTLENDKLKWFTIERITMDWSKGGCYYDVGCYQPSNHGSHDARDMFSEPRCFLTKEELFATL